jgi:hypothetical protein
MDRHLPFAPLFFFSAFLLASISCETDDRRGYENGGGIPNGSTNGSGTNGEENGGQNGGEISLTAETQADLDEFFALHGGASAFPQSYLDAITALVTVEDLVVAGDYSNARAQLDTLFATYPLSDPIWWQGVGQDGTNVGTPVAYYGLRMLDDIVDTGLSQTPSAPEKILLTVLMATCAEGNRPTDLALTQPGEEVQLSLDPALTEDNHRILRQSLRLFQHYIWSISDGHLELDLAFETVDMCVQVAFSADPNFSTIQDAASVVRNASAAAHANSDMWWVLYPSNVPSDPLFDSTAFITGGMGLYGPGQPLFIIDDLWVVRKPPHLGSGPYTDLERRVYLPQWLQHEFFHHLYRTWPEFGLEDELHQWFERNTWPSDFIGEWEPDYYAESLNKRLRTANPTIATKLKTAPPGDDVLSLINQEDLLGDYEKQPVENDWHTVFVEEDIDGLWWRNAAGVRWSLTWQDNTLMAGAGCPYGEQPLTVDLARDENGAYTTEILGLYFSGERYVRVGP